MSRADEWRVLVRDADLNRLGELEFDRLDLKLRYNDAGTWMVEVHRNARLVRALCEPGAGVIVTRNGVTQLSGSWEKQDHTRDADSNTVQVSGRSDVAILDLAVAHPQPGSSAPPYSTSAEDTRTGVASTLLYQFASVNVGGGAIAPRRRLTVATDPVVGASVTGSARWQSLLALLQEIAAASEAAGTPVRFDVKQDGAAIQLSIYPVTDRSSTVKLGIGLGNVAEFKYVREAPKATYVYVGGDGEGTARTIREVQDATAVAAWGRREAFTDARSGNTNTELDQAGKVELVESTEKRALSVTPIDTEALRFGVEYNLGDKVSLVMDAIGDDPTVVESDTVVDILREVDIRVDESGVDIKPVVGTAGAKLAHLRLFSAIRGLRRQIRNLERR